MADAATAFGNWVDDAQWDFVQLGGVFLPGVATVEHFTYGLDVDIQKRRKKEKARLRDNGIAPCAFRITVELTEDYWQQWCEVLPVIQPRRTGAIRSPLKIVHPLPNLSGVQDVYVKNIQYSAPSARAGLKVEIEVGEWFEEEKDSNQSKTVKDDAHKRLDPNDHDPINEENMAQGAFRNTDNVVDYIKLNP